MRTKLFVLAILVLFIPIVTACQTKSSASPSEIFEAVKPLNDTKAALLIEFCRGQTPQQITREEYDSWPDAAKQYVTNNASQWISAGCKA